MDSQLVRSDEALAALVADVRLLEGVLRPPVVDQLLTSHETSAAVVAEKICDPLVKVQVVPKQK